MKKFIVNGKTLSVVLLVITFIMTACGEENRDASIKEIRCNNNWTIYRIDSLHILCVPNNSEYNPSILTIQK